MKDLVGAIHMAEEPSLFKQLLLADCCSLFSTIWRMQLNANARCARLILVHLRDFLALLTISFVDSSVNIGDAGAKNGGRNSLLLEFMTAGRFGISSVVRKGKPIRAKGWMIRELPPTERDKKE